MDVGENAYAMVLADDVDGNGRMDLVLATMNGNVYCFETGAHYHPLKAWPSQVIPCNLPSSMSSLSSLTVSMVVKC